MPTYTSDTNLLTELPDNLPAALDTPVERAPYIEQASLLADSLVGPRFPIRTYGAAEHKFPDITDTPPTPPLVELGTRKLAAAMVYGALSLIGREGDVGGKGLYDEALEWFRRIREGELQVTDSEGTDYAAFRPVSSTTEAVEPTFRSGRYDADGELLDERPGSVDAF